MTRLSKRGVTELLARARDPKARLPTASMTVSVNVHDLENAMLEITRRREADPGPDDIAKARDLIEWCDDLLATNPKLDGHRDIKRLLESLLRACGAT